MALLFFRSIRFWTTLKVLLCGISLPFWSWAQTGVQGTVKDAQTGDPLIGVTVQIEGGNLGTSTDLDGRFELPLDPGEYTLLLSYVGYSNNKQAILVEAKQWTRLQLTLAESQEVTATIVVTDGKYEKKLEQSTTSIDVINTQQLQNNNATSLDQVVKKASGVQITDGQISIRGGAGYAYGVGSRVIFLVDGQPLLSAELSDVKWNFLPIENAQQVEIIKGSASVLYGSGALNGVVNLRTAYPKGNESYTAFSTYIGLFDQPRIDSMGWFDPREEPATRPMYTGLFFAHRHRIHPNVDLVLGGNFHLQNDYYKDADERRFRFNFSTRFRPPQAEGRLSLGLNGNLMYHENGRFFMARNMSDQAYLNLSPIFRDRYYSIALDPYITVFDGAENKHDVRGRWFRISKVQEQADSEADLLSLEYQFQREFGERAVVTAGVLGQYWNVNSILFAAPDAEFWERALFTAGSIAAYAQWDQRIGKRLSTTLGVRWEGFVVDTSILTAVPIVRLGLNYEITNHDYLRTSFGQGFRIPSLAERYFNERLPGSFIGIYPNPDLQPETGWTAEIAYRRTFGGKRASFYLDAAFFVMEYNNMVEFVLGLHPPGPGLSFINVSKARIGGWELSAQGDIMIGNVPLRIWGGYTYSFPGDLSDTSSRLRNWGNFAATVFDQFTHRLERDDYVNILKYRRLHTLRFDLETEWKGFTLGTALNYNSFMHKIDLLFEFDLVTPGVDKFRSIHNKGYWLWDLRLGYAFNPKQCLNLVIQNVLNEEYAVRPAQMGAPRSFSLQYSHQF